MKVTDFSVAGPKLIELKSFSDDRGFFVERYRKNIFSELGVPADFVQDNFSRSQSKVLRGLHYQFERPQGKLVTALRGRVYDVAVDIREGSPTFGQWVGIELDGQNPSWFWVPAGFAHGFVVLSEGEADVLYKVDAYYNPQGEDGIVWNDSDLSIAWPIPDPILSPRDLNLKTWGAYLENPRF